MSDGKWTFEKDGTNSLFAIRDECDGIVCRLYDESDARLIVTAVNAHERLVAALRGVRFWVLRVVESNTDIAGFDATKHFEVVAIDAALALAEKTP